MAYERNLLKLAEIPAFRAMLERQGVECRDGKGEFQLLQVHTSAQCWAVINRNAQGVVTTHPELAPYIKAFRMNAALNLKRDDTAKQARPDSFIEDLRDDFAMHALQGVLANPYVMKPDPDTGIVIGLRTPELAAREAYRFADAMLEARKARRA